MPLSEADNRAILIDPALHDRVWIEDFVCRETTASGAELINNVPRRRRQGRTDYVLRVRVNVGAQSIAVALIEAKPENLAPGHGLEQGKGYAACKRLNVPLSLDRRVGEFRCEIRATFGADKPMKPEDSNSY